ncbi:MAG: hypothetical protein K2X29_00685 [Candidatus Obscuribacterales bacterium]|nr:hypothetical protein [Candidatus Obscuribacterales bacterium]
MARNDKGYIYHDPVNNMIGKPLFLLLLCTAITCFVLGIVFEHNQQFTTITGQHKAVYGRFGHRRSSEQAALYTK